MAKDPVKEKVESASVAAKKDKKIIASPEEVKGETKITQKIYVGPNLRELQKYTVMENGFTKHVEEVIKKCPSVGKLFIAIEKMAYTEKRIQEKGTLEHRHYNNVIAYGSGKGEE